MGQATRATMVQKLSPMPFQRGGGGLFGGEIFTGGTPGATSEATKGASSGVTFGTLVLDLALVRGGTGMGPFDTRLGIGISGFVETWG